MRLLLIVDGNYLFGYLTKKNLPTFVLAFIICILGEKQNNSEYYTLYYILSLILLRNLLCTGLLSI